MKTLTIIVPTIGRKSLRRTLESFAPDLKRDDVVHVSMDGRSSLVRRLIEEMGDRYLGNWHYHEGPRRGVYGHPLRNEILPIVNTDLVWTIDDDDVAAPGAIRAIRETDENWRIFRMLFCEGHPACGVTCWRFKSVKHGDVGTPMFVAKPSAARFGISEEIDGDWIYAKNLLEIFGEPTWDDRVIALIRPPMEDDEAPAQSGDFLSV